MTAFLFKLANIKDKKIYAFFTETGHWMNKLLIYIRFFESIGR